MKKIITVIDARFSLYLTIHMVILQFLQHWSISLTMSVLVVGVLEKDDVVYNGGFDFQYVYAPRIILNLS